MPWLAARRLARSACAVQAPSPVRRRTGESGWTLRFGVRNRRRGFVLAVAVVVAFGEPCDGHDTFAGLEIDQAHTLRVATDDTDLVHAQPDHRPAARDQHDLIVVGDHADADDPAGLLGRLHGDDALAAAP